MTERTVSESESASPKGTTFGTVFSNIANFGNSRPKSGIIVPGTGDNITGFYKSKSEDDLLNEIGNAESSPTPQPADVSASQSIFYNSGEEKVTLPPPKTPDKELDPTTSFIQEEKLNIARAEVNRSPRFLRDRKEKKAKEKVFLGPVFGVSLEKADLDETEQVPKFVMECIKIIEEKENLTTSGIYRASGNKTSIEAIKKKLQEKPKRESRYACLQNQDVHSITGILKQFFRETSDLIPEEVFARLPKNFSHDSSLPLITNEIDQIDEVPRKTLKFLINHLRIVNDNCSENLMTSANLAICWGPSLLNKNIQSITSLIENDIMNRNVLIKVLIDKYDFIFEHKNS